MNTPVTNRNETVDATNMRLGHLATKVASLLMGKDTATFARHTVEDVTVTVTNVSKLDLSEKKRKEIYQTFSGYPGGRKTETLDHLATRRGYSEVVRRTISGMLPNNKLKKQLLKQLVISE